MSRIFITALIVFAFASVIGGLSGKSISIMGFDVQKPEPIITKDVPHSTQATGASLGCPRFVAGMVLTVAQWQACFDSKQDRVVDDAGKSQVTANGVYQ